MCARGDSANKATPPLQSKGTPPLHGGTWGGRGEEEKLSHRKSQQLFDEGRKRERERERDGLGRRELDCPLSCLEAIGHNANDSAATAQIIVAAHADVAAKSFCWMI